MFIWHVFLPVFQVVGGMTWCITTCNFDVDVDLLFQENSTIGQKMLVHQTRDVFDEMLEDYNAVLEDHIHY